jgi:hypothetical protein
MKLGKANERYLRAFQFAVEVHGRAKQERKSTDFPYAVHPVRVAAILHRYDRDEDVVIAGFLHDTIEDAGVTAEIRQQFGERVARIVQAVSEDKSLSWEERKQHTVERLKSDADADALSVSAADKLDNIRSIRENLVDLGPTKTWKRFKRPEPAQRTYYHAIVDALVDRDRGNHLFQELALEVDEVFPVPSGPRSTFFYAKELRSPQHVRPYLGDPRLHWREGRSAYELAASWIGAGGFPNSVEVALRGSPFAAARLIEGFFEREVDLGSRGHRSQTDLMLLVKLEDGYGVVAVEGKVDEPFGDVVAEWNTSPTKEERLEGLCRDLEIDRTQVNSLRYQLLHRTASAVREAQHYGARAALMLVHSFDNEDAGFMDFTRFAEVLGFNGMPPNAISGPSATGGVELWLGWVKDQPRRI